jgi:hypothetical protein
VTLGSNSQPVSVQLDTGSIELWVDPNCANSQLPAFCDTLPRYDPTTSSTSIEYVNVFEVTYGSGSVSGQYYQDTVSAGAASVPGEFFGVAATSETVAFGILGIGPAPYIGYYPFIYSLANQGSIAKAAFSLDLRSIGDPEGKSSVKFQ